MGSLKKFTARKCNKILSRDTSFWQQENYDHVIRNYDQLLRIIKYTLNNPVKAGLTATSEEWQWNYYNSDLL